MDELKKKTKEFYISFGITSPVMILIAIVVNYYRGKPIDPGFYVIILAAISIFAYFRFCDLKKLLNKVAEEYNEMVTHYKKEDDNSNIIKK